MCIKKNKPSPWLPFIGPFLFPVIILIILIAGVFAACFIRERHSTNVVVNNYDSIMVLRQICPRPNHLPSLYNTTDSNICNYGAERCKCINQ